MPRLSRTDYKYLLDKTSGQGFSKAQQCGKKVNLKKYLDDVWSKAVKERAGNHCEKCGSIKGLNSHHVFSRRYMTIRHDIENGVCLCSAHHWPWAHHCSGEFHIWIIAKRGQEWFDKLQALKNTTIKGL